MNFVKGFIHFFMKRIHGLFTAILHKLLYLILCGFYKS